MITLEEKLILWLFETDALRICPEDKPFWYTSGTIGPYYVNTHFLYGSEESANNLLKEIDILKEQKLKCPEEILKLTKANYDSNSVYRNLIDELCSYILENIDLTEIACISGGERRDWFFSLISADLLKKPHMTIYKDLTAVYTENSKTVSDFSLSGGKVLHIADLINEASSYERAWIPAVKNYGGILTSSQVIVDRRQGGEKLLSAYGVKSHAMIGIDEALFKKAYEMRLINERQFQLIMEYIRDPKASMKAFLKLHPEFLTSSLNGDKKTSERAKLCLEKDFYEL